MSSEHFAQLIIAAIGGSGLGVLGLWAFQKYKLTHFKQIAEDIIKKAESDGDALKRTAELAAKQNTLEQQRELELQWQTEKRKAQREEDRLKQREDKLETRMNLVDKKLSDIEKREAYLSAQQAQFDNEKKSTALTQEKLIEQLEKAAGFSINEAKDYLISQITNDVKTEAANLIRRTKKEAEEEAENEANRIISTAINRLAVRCVSEATVNTVSIPNDEMKGRIIGREGRNIRALERATGINIIIDETPNAVVLSGFDPIRMHIAKTALTELIKDGRIHPTRIEEVVEKTKQEIQKQIKQHGEDAALRAGAMNLHPELIMLVGKLKFRYSYGQNILDHSLEVSHLMGIMAAELGLNVRLARRIGLLHDFGKAVSHEIEGSHAVIGHDLALKYGETKEVANGIGCHHYEMEATTIEGSLCSAADAISASRQGARSEPVEEYVTRLKKLEDLALDFTGVEKAYAMQAGREVRVIVVPELIDDDGVETMAKELTQKIEKNLSYPGKIKVTIIREKRFVEYAV